MRGWSRYAALVPARRLDYSTPTACVSPAPARSSSVRTSISTGSPPCRAPAWWRTRWSSAERAAEIDAIDVASTALVDEPVALGGGPAGTAVIEPDRPGAIRLAVRAPTRQLLVLAESFHSGWRVRVDGADARVLRVNGDFMGVVVEPGVHVLDFSFAPRSFTIGCWTSLAGIAIVLAVALAGLLFPRSP